MHIVSLKREQRHDNYSTNKPGSNLLTNNLINKKNVDALSISPMDQGFSDSIQVLKENHFAALESLALLLLREVDSMRKTEARLKDGMNGNGICLYDETQRFEASLIRSALIRAGGLQTTAARLLGMKYTTLNLKIKRYNIDLTNFKPDDD